MTFAAGTAAGVAVPVCAFIPSPGWLMAAIIAAVVVAALVFAGCKCASAAATRSWLPATTSQRSKLNGAPLLTLSSQMTCPAEGGIITAQETFWEAWGTQALTNLGHISNFAFGFLVGRGGASMVAEASTAAAGASSAGQAATTFARTFGKSFLNTAKENLVQQFTGWNQGGLFCRFMKGFGLYGQAKEHYDIWTDDEKSTWEKVKESGMSLILDVFAAKGATTVCFPAGTKVHTQWGLADIEKLEIGVPVLTYNEETGEQEYKKVKKVMRRMTRRMCALELSNGTTLEVTPEHRFFCNGEWTPIEELNVNDTLQLKDNSIVVIENKIIFPTFVEVYNLEIEDNENYYVTDEGVLVHNGYKNKASVKVVDEVTHDVEVTISKSDYPETCSHIEDAINKGHEQFVTIDRKMAASNRAESLSGVPTKPGFDRDEWPMAMFSEGGKGADIRYINPSDNRGAGSAIGNALKEYPDGTIVKIIIAD